MPVDEDSSTKAKNHCVKIRQMEIDDLPVVFHLGERLFAADKVPNLYRTWDQYEVVELFNADSEFCLVAELNERITGFALGTTVTKSRSAWKYGYLIWLGVEPSLQREGVAQKLFNRFKDLMLKTGVRMLLVDTEAENLRAPGKRTFCGGIEGGLPPFRPLVGPRPFCKPLRCQPAPEGRREAGPDWAGKPGQRP